MRKRMKSTIIPHSKKQKKEYPALERSIVITLTLCESDLIIYFNVCTCVFAFYGRSSLATLTRLYLESHSEAATGGCHQHRKVVCVFYGAVDSFVFIASHHFVTQGGQALYEFE